VRRGRQQPERSAAHGRGARPRCDQGQDVPRLAGDARRGGDRRAPGLDARPHARAPEPARAARGPRGLHREAPGPHGGGGRAHAPGRGRGRAPDPDGHADPRGRELPPRGRADAGRRDRRREGGARADGQGLGRRAVRRREGGAGPPRLGPVARPEPEPALLRRDPPGALAQVLGLRDGHARGHGEPSPRPRALGARPDPARGRQLRGARGPSRRRARLVSRHVGARGEGHALRREGPLVGRRPQAGAEGRRGQPDLLEQRLRVLRRARRPVRGLRPLSAPARQALRGLRAAREVDPQVDRAPRGVARGHPLRRSDHL